MKTTQTGAHVLFTYRMCPGCRDGRRSVDGIQWIYGWNRVFQTRSMNRFPMHHRDLHYDYHSSHPNLHDLAGINMGRLYNSHEYLPNDYRRYNHRSSSYYRHRETPLCSSPDWETADRRLPGLSFPHSPGVDTLLRAALPPCTAVSRLSDLTPRNRSGCKTVTESQTTNQRKTRSKRLPNAW